MREMRAPQDQDFFLGLLFFEVFAFLAAAFLGAAFFVAAPEVFCVLCALGRFFSAARCAAASADLAQALSSSVASNSRAGNCQYELTVTVLARVW
jgi:hypothetical protein